MPTRRSKATSLQGKGETNSPVSLSDVTHLLTTQAERFLEDSKAWATERGWLRAMIDQVPDYLFVKDTEARFVVANKSVAADLGEDSNDLLGKTDLDLHPKELAERFYANDRQVIDSGEPMLDIEEFVILKSNRIRWLSTSKLPLRNADGKIIGLVGIARDITERKRAEDEIRYLAFHDVLTGLANRGQFERRLTEMIDGLAPDAGGAVFYIDLDRFKHINDTLGHPAGDALIRQVAERLRAALPEETLVARIGGDEFSLLTDAEDAAILRGIAATVLAELAAPFALDGHAVYVGGSVGVAEVKPGKDLQHILREADIALYEAKGRGGGCWVAFAPQMATALELKSALEDDLRFALLAGDQLFLEYQSVFAADAKTVLGAEALMRWRHPQRGILSPAEFIGVAEERGLIDQMGDWALQRACEAVAGTTLPWVAVNVSPIQLRDPAFSDRVLAILAGAGVVPDRFQIEITENVFLDGLERTQTLLQTLRDAGIKIAIDDFGMGYSSLGYLDRYNVDKLKIDRSFVAKLGTSRRADAIVGCIITLGRAMGMRVTAEGVETDTQSAHLASIGCHELQGFLLSRPLDLATLIARDR